MRDAARAHDGPRTDDHGDRGARGAGPRRLVGADRARTRSTVGRRRRDRRARPATRSSRSTVTAGGNGRTTSRTRASNTPRSTAISSSSVRSPASTRPARRRVRRARPRDGPGAVVGRGTGRARSGHVRGGRRVRRHDERPRVPLTRDGGQVWHWSDASRSRSPRGSLAYDATTDRLGLHRVHQAGSGVGVPRSRATALAARLPLGVERTPSAAAAAGDGRFVVGDGTTNEVLVVDAQSDDVTAGVRTDGEFDPASVPVVADGVAYVVNRIGTVTAMDVATGRLRWQHAAAHGRTRRAARPHRRRGRARRLARSGAGARPGRRSSGAGRDRRARGIVAGSRLADEVVVSLRFGVPSRVAAWPVP